MFTLGCWHYAVFRNSSGLASTMHTGNEHQCVWAGYRSAEWESAHQARAVLGCFELCLILNIVAVFWGILALAQHAFPKHDVVVAGSRGKADARYKIQDARKTRGKGQVKAKAKTGSRGEVQGARFAVNPIGRLASLGVVISWRMASIRPEIAWSWLETLRSSSSSLAERSLWVASSWRS